MHVIDIFDEAIESIEEINITGVVKGEECSIPVWDGEV